MQQWAVALVLVLPHASICDAPAFNYYLTDLSLTLFHVAFLDVGTYICQLVVVFSSALSPTAEQVNSRR